MGINFKKLKNKSNDDDFSPIPEGRYDLAVDQGELKESKNGYPYIEFTLKVVDDEDNKNRKIWHIFSLKEKAQVFLLRFLQAAGSSIIESDEEVEPKDIIKDAIGRRVNAYVTIKKVPGKDKKRNEIEGNFKPANSESQEASSGSDKDSGSSKDGKKKSGKNLFK